MNPNTSGHNTCIWNKLTYLKNTTVQLILHPHSCINYLYAVYKRQIKNSKTFKMKGKWMVKYISGTYNKEELEVMATVTSDKICLKAKDSKGKRAPIHNAKKKNLPKLKVWT